MQIMYENELKVSGMCSVECDSYSKGGLINKKMDIKYETSSINTVSTDPIFGIL